MSKEGLLSEVAPHEFEEWTAIVNGIESYSDYMDKFYCNQRTLTALSRFVREADYV